MEFVLNLNKLYIVTERNKIRGILTTDEGSSSC